MDGNRCAGLAHAFPGRRDGHDRGIAFGRGRHIQDGLGEDDFRLGHSDALHRLSRRYCHCQRLWIRISHILGRADHDPARDELDILPRVQHFCQIIHRRIRVRSPHALDKCRDRVIVVVSGLVVVHHTLLDAFRSHLQGDMDQAVLAAVCGQDPQFHRIERVSGIPSGNIRQKIQGVLVNLRMEGAHPLFLVIHCPAQDRLDILLIQRMELKDAGSGQQRSIDLKIRVFRSRPDQRDGAVLHKRKQIILLSLVETVDLIDKQDGLLLIHPQQFFCLLNDLLHVLLARGCGIDLLKFGTGRVGDDLCQGGLARPRRPVKNDGAQLVRPDRPIQQLILSNDVLLPRHLLQSHRTHPGCQGRLLFLSGFSHIIK